MLNSISDVTAAADTRVADCWPFMGAFLPAAVNTVHQSRSGALVFTRPRAISGTAMSGLGRKAAVHGLAQGQPSVRKQYPIMTRSAAAIGGALGPHPARDPV
jgi:hypothetical protein